MSPTVDGHVAPAMGGDASGSGGGRDGEEPRESLEDMFVGLNLHGEEQETLDLSGEIDDL